MCFPFAVHSSAYLWPTASVSPQALKVTRKCWQRFGLWNKAGIVCSFCGLFCRYSKEIFRIPEHVCWAVMSQVQYTKHASLQCETHPGWPQNTKVLEKPNLVTKKNNSIWWDSLLVSSMPWKTEREVEKWIGKLGHSLRNKWLFYTNIQGLLSSLGRSIHSLSALFNQTINIEWQLTIY